MNAILLTLTGCDDSTSFVLTDVTPEIEAALRRIARLSRDVSDFACQPIMSIGNAPTPDDLWGDNDGPPEFALIPKDAA